MSLALLHEAGAVAFTDAINAVNKSSVMYKALKYASAFDILLMQHPEEKELSDWRVNDLWKTFY